MQDPPAPLMTSAPLPGLDDPEGERVPDGLPPVIDAHVHVFPDAVWPAVHRWFDDHAWPVRYRLRSPAIVRFLLDRGAERVVALQYAHRPGLAPAMNAEMVALCRAEPRVIGLATAYPGEEGAEDELRAAFARGLAGIKLHLHVLGMPLDDPRVLSLLRVCAEQGKPALVHSGREPNSPAYPADTHAICSADRVDRVLRALPALRLCVPHLGGDEFDEHADLLQRHEHLVLDTTMMLAGYFPYEVRWDLVERFPGRVMYGSDFPNIPYAWDRELRAIADRGFDRDLLRELLAGTAERFYGATG